MSTSIATSPSVRETSDQHRNAGTVFQQEWQIYRKMVDNNYLFHREAYAALHGVLTDDAPHGFRFLDIACGDASASILALRGAPIGHYHGIDTSGAALELAREVLAELPCPVTLEQRDFVEALRDRPDSADVAWIGLSLHHLRTAGKLALMHELRGTVGDRGLLVFYENTSPDGEDRDAWLARWDLQRPAWAAYAQMEWDTMTEHVRASDFPETESSWRRLAEEAGFGSICELFRSPTDLFRMYCLQA